MKVIIAGSRTVTNPLFASAAVLWSGFSMSEVVCGGAKGADALGREWAEAKGVRVKHFPADWERLGNKAGPLRNAQMAEYADALIALWDGVSRGTKSMIELAREKNLPIRIMECDHQRTLMTYGQNVALCPTCSRARFPFWVEEGTLRHYRMMCIRCE